MTDQWLIRGARHDECALLSDLAFRSKACWGYSEQFMEDCRGELTISEADIQNHQFFVLECDGAVIGFCALQSCGALIVEILDEPCPAPEERIGRIKHGNGENVAISFETLQELMAVAREVRRGARTMEPNLYPALNQAGIVSA